jgi:hypothetical protein
VTPGAPADRAPDGPLAAPVPGGPARPRRLDAVESVYQTLTLSLRRSFRGPRLIVALVLILLPLAISFPVSRRAGPREQEVFFYEMLSFYHFRIAVPGVALAFATAFPWPEVEEGTLTYWFTAPIRRWTVHLGRFAASWITGTLVLPLCIVAIAAPLRTPETSGLRDVAVTAVAATLLAFPAYLALFWLVATWFRRGLAIGVVFILVETFVAQVPANLARVTLLFYVRSMIHPAVPKGSRYAASKLLHVLEPVPVSDCVLTFVLSTVVALVLSLLLVESVEYRGKTSQAG